MVVFKFARYKRNEIKALSNQFMGASNMSCMELSANKLLRKYSGMAKPTRLLWDGLVAHLPGTFADFAENGKPCTDDQKV